MKEIKQFQTESKELLNLVINSIYSNKDIFLRELISNASDAIDKYKYMALTEKDISVKDYEIWLSVDKDARTLTIKDNGIGMSKEGLIDNLGTIAKSGSKEFLKKIQDSKDKADTNIIGQFGVGFYSAFMVADKITVRTKSLNDKGYVFESDGQDSYSIDEDPSIENAGTEIILHLKDDTDEVKYSYYLEDYEIQELVKKYSDYIRYPIKMNITRHEQKKDVDGKPIENAYEDIIETKTLNSMVPLWKQPKKDVTDEKLNAFYKEKFMDYEDPLLAFNVKVDGLVCYNALLYIPSHVPQDVYSTEYEKGLDLYAKGVFIQEKCKALIPDYLRFVHGLVDSDDLSLNISREMLQDDATLAKIKDSIEKKILSNLKDLKEHDNEKYLKFFNLYGSFFKYGIYSSYGSKKEELQDMLYYDCLSKDQMITLKDYVSGMSKDQKYIYYACGKTLESIRLLPQIEKYKKNNIEVLFLKDSIDEFTMLMMHDYDGKEFKNIGEEDKSDLTTEEKEKVENLVKDNKDLLTSLKDALKDKVDDVTFSSSLVDSPVCISTKDKVSMNVEEVMDKQPETSGKVKSNKVLEINPDHELFQAIKTLSESGKNVEAYADVLYNEALLLQGFDIKDKTDFVKSLNQLMVDALKK